MILEKNKIQISLRAARISSGYTPEEAAKHVNISVDALDEYELDSGELPLEVAIKLLELYRFPFALIHFGNESEFIKSRRNDNIML